MKMHGSTLELIEKIVWECLLSSLQSITSFWSERACLYWLWRRFSALCWSAEVGELRPGAALGPFSVLIHPTEQFSLTNTLGQPLKPPKFHVSTAPKNCLPWPPRASENTKFTWVKKFAQTFMFDLYNTAKHALFPVFIQHIDKALTVTFLAQPSEFVRAGGWLREYDSFSRCLDLEKQTCKDFWLHFQNLRECCQTEGEANLRECLNQKGATASIDVKAIHFSQFHLDLFKELICFPFLTETKMEAAEVHWSRTMPYRQINVTDWTTLLTARRLWKWAHLSVQTLRYLLKAMGRGGSKSTNTRATVSYVVYVIK